MTVHYTYVEPETDPYEKLKMTLEEWLKVGDAFEESIMKMLDDGLGKENEL